MSQNSYSALFARMVQPTMVDYPGKMSALFFTRGCNFRCGFCHNPGLLEDDQKAFTWDELNGFCKEYRKQWVDAVSISGGEPTLQPCLKETLEFFRKQGFAIKLDSNGSQPEVLKEVLPLVDYVAMDIKCSPESYSTLTGWNQLDNIQESIHLIIESAKDYEFRTTVIEGFHTDKEILGCAKLVQGAKRLIFQPFLPRPDLPNPEFRKLERTRQSTLQNAVKIATPWVKSCSTR